MVVIPPMDAQPGEAIWRLLTGAAQDSWEAICKHSHHSTTPELRPRRGGGGEGGDGHNDLRGEGGRGSGGNNNNNNNDDNNGNRGSRGKITTEDADTTTAAAAAAETPTTAKAAATTSTTAAAADTVTQEAQTATPATTAATPAAADTTSVAAAAPTTAEAATPAAADKTNNTTAAAATETAAETAAAAAAAAVSAAPAAVDDTTTAAAVAAATQTAGSGPDTARVNTNGQTTSRHAAATTAGATGTIGAAAATGSPYSPSSPTTPIASSSPGSGAATTTASNTGLIAGVVVGVVAVLGLAFLLYWFRRSKCVKALFCCGVGRKNKNSSSSSDGGSDDQDIQASHIADSNARLVSGASANSLLTPTSISMPASALGMGMGMDSKRGDNDMAEKMNLYGGDAKNHSHDDEKRELAYASATAAAHDLPPPITPTSAVSSTASSSTASFASAARPAGRRRSPSYSTFPSATRSHNYSNSITLAQSGSLPGLPHTAAQRDRQASQTSQSTQSTQSAQSVPPHQKKNSVPRVSVDAPNNAMGFPFKQQPQQRMSRHASGSLTLSTAPEGLVPPPRSSTSRQRPPAAGADENDADDAISLAPTFNRSSYTESVGGESISSSVLMSPSLLQWPVPPQTPPVSQFGSDAGRALSASNSSSNLSSSVSSSATVTAGRSKSQESNESGSTGTNSQGSGPLFDRVAIVPSHVPTVVPASPLPVPRRPLTTVSSASSNAVAQAQPPPMPARGSMPTRASLSGPSSRSLMQTQAARRPSIASIGSGSIGHAVAGMSPSRPQYPQRLPPTGYVPPHASAVTVHHTGQATSVRVPIARNPPRY